MSWIDDTRGAAEWGVSMVKPDVANFRMAAGADEEQVRLLARANGHVSVTAAWQVPTVQWVPQTLTRPAPDFGIAGTLDLLSRRAAAILHDFLGPNGEILEIDGLGGGYVGFHLLRTSDALDLSASTVSKNPVSGTVSAIWTAVFDGARLKQDHLFRVPTNTTCWFASDTFKRSVEMNNLTGFRFVPALIR